MQKLLEVFDFYDTMERKNIMLSFKGEVTPELLASILQIVENKLDKINEQPKIKKKVFNVLVECLQNLYHHYTRDSHIIKLKDDQEPSVIVMIAKNVSGYSIITGNYVANSNVDELKKRLEEINSMSKLELKELYKSVLSNGELSAKGGGGLGIIDIARKSGEKLEYGFIPFSNGASFFSLNVNITDN